MALGILAGAASSIVGQGLGMALAPQQDARQLKQQEKLNELQIKGNERMSEFQKQQQLDLWNKTNVEAQVEHYKNAGMNPALVYGLGGGGGTTAAAAGGNAVSGGNAADAASTANAQTAQVGMGLQMASQLALQKAQKENIEADTANKKAGADNLGVKTEGEKISNEINTETKGDQIKTIQETANKALADAVQSVQKQVISEETMKDQIKTIQEEALNKILTNKSITIENRKKEAETAIKQFEAKMAENGISASTPWYIKLINDQTKKYGLDILR